MAISAHDIVSTSPTNTFATLNVLGEGLSGTLSDGNLKNVMGNAHNSLRGNFYISSGQWYWEVYVVSATNSLLIGLSSIDEIIGTTFNPAKSISFYSYDGKIYYNSTSANYDSAYVSTDIIGVFLDDNQLSFYKNGSVLNSGTTIDLSNAIYNLGTLNFTPRFDDGSGTAGGATFYVNFGADSSFGGTKTGSTNASDANGLGDFYYAPPTGALALCTANIQSNLAIDPAVDDLPEDYFKAVTYTGKQQADWDGTTGTVTVGFQPDLVWTKPRNVASSHNWIDSVRGTLKYIRSDGTGQESTYPGSITSFNTNGYSLGTGADFNTLNDTYVAWCWKAGGAPSGAASATGSAKRINTSGTQDDTSCDALASAATSAGASNVITPTLMSIGIKQGFSIIKYTATGSAATVPHGLGKAPEFVIVKQTNANGFQWMCYHVSLGATKGLKLQATAAEVTDSNLWNNTTPTSSVVTLGAHGSDTNNTGGTNIMYAFTSIEGFSAFGSYTGNASADGPFIYTGFKPALVICKTFTYATTTNTSWAMFDNAREPNNVMNKPLYANQSAAEGKRGDGSTAATDIYIDFLSTGFKIRSTHTEHNSDQDSILYACWAEMPQKYSVAR